MPPGPPIAYPFADFLINPQTNWSRWFNPQLFISLNSSDAPIENHVLSRVGSYGKQLGVLLDIADVLVARLPADELTPTERRAVAALADLRDDVEEAKSEFRGDPVTSDLTRGDVDRLLANLDDLQSATTPTPTATSSRGCERRWTPATARPDRPDGHRVHRRHNAADSTWQISPSAWRAPEATPGTDRNPWAMPT